jgi:hypothetical protein
MTFINKTYPNKPFPQFRGTDIVWYVDPLLMCPRCPYGVRANAESKICGECYNELNGMRHIETDEVIFDIDNRENHGKLCFIQTGINLVNAGYNIEIWYAEGQKQPHTHVKNIKGLLGLPKEVLKKYKQLFTEKYIPKEFWNEKIPDSSLYLSTSLIAEENKPHKKYKTPKLLIQNFNQDKENVAEQELLNQAWATQQTISKPRELKEGQTHLYQKIGAKISIKYIADCFGLEPLNSNMRHCPFHSDGTPSLSLSDDKALYHCYGCKTSGNIIDFYVRLKQLNPKFKLEATTS